MAIYYVSTTGSDSNAGTSAGSPWRSIQHACDTVVAGDTVHVAAGLYDQNNAADNVDGYHYIYLPTSGTSIAPITFISDTPRGAHVVATGPRSGNNMTWFTGGDYVTLQGFEITGDQIGIYWSGSHGTIQSNYIHDTPRSGIYIANGAYTNTNVDSIGNLIVNCSATSLEHGIYHAIAGGHIWNNIIIKTSGYCIQLWHAATGVTIANNLCSGGGNPNVQGGILIGAGDAPGGVTCDNCIVTNNIVRDILNAPNSSDGIQEHGTTGTHNQYVNNCLWNNTVNFLLQNGNTSSGSVLADPKLVNYVLSGFGGNYQLYTGSPCIDAGTSTGAPTTDYAGISRPQGAGYDIGPYEYSASTGRVASWMAHR